MPSRRALKYGCAFITIKTAGLLCKTHVVVVNNIVIGRFNINAIAGFNFIAADIGKAYGK